MTEKTDPIEQVIGRLAAHYRGIKFGRGVVGKTSYVTIAILALWLLIILRLSDDPWLNSALFGAGLVASGIYFWWTKRTQDFATANPGLALLEGAELIEYQKWEAQIKGQPALKSVVTPGPNDQTLIDADKEGR